jgi:ankyrin repeat protein
MKPDQAAMATELMSALITSDVQAVSRLLGAGLDPNLDFPLEVASRGSVLLGHMSNWHGSGSLSRYPAFLEAVLRGDPSIVRCMLDAGADACQCVDDGGSSKWSAIDLACVQGHVEVVSAIARHGGYAVSDKRISSVAAARFDVAECLAQFPQSHDVQQALLSRLAMADVEILRRSIPKLVAAGARLDGPEHGDSPLCNAITKTDVEKVRLLIEAGATVTKGSQSSAMRQACALGAASSIRLLTQAGATVHEIDIGLALASKNDDAIVAVLENCRTTGMSHKNMRPPRKATLSPVVEAVIKGGYVKAAHFLFASLGEDPYQKTSTGAPILRIANAEMKQVIASARTNNAVADATGSNDDTRLLFAEPRSPKPTGEPL